MKTLHLVIAFGKVPFERGIYDQRVVAAYENGEDAQAHATLLSDARDDFARTLAPEFLQAEYDHYKSLDPYFENFDYVSYDISRTQLRAEVPLG